LATKADVWLKISASNLPKPQVKKKKRVKGERFDGLHMRAENIRTLERRDQLSHE